MSQTSGLLSSFHSIKSLPPKFKFTGDQAHDFLEEHELGITDVIASSKPENGALGRQVSKEVKDPSGDMDPFYEDSPYSENAISLEGRTSSGDESTESVPLPLPSISQSSTEHRWGDTTPYPSKKVLLAPDSSFNFFISKSFNHTFVISISSINNFLILK